MNPYTSSGSVATMTANVSGNDSLNDLGDGPRQPGDPERYPVGAVTRRLMGYVRPHRISFAASFVSAAISVILQLYTPILIGEGIDLIVAAGQVDFDALLPLVTKLALVVVGAASFQWLQGYCVNRLSYETVRDMRVEASDKLSRMPLSFIDSHAHGDLMSRVVNDVDQVGDGLLQGFTQLFTGVITIVGTLAFMLSINLTMTLVVVLVTPLSIFAASAIAKLSNKSFSVFRVSLAAISRSTWASRSLSTPLPMARTLSNASMPSMPSSTPRASARSLWVRSPTPVRVLSITSSMPWSL